jgi:tetratricopeptide (TPR) repeat protein
MRASNFQLAFALGKTGRNAEAIAAYERTIALDPGSPRRTENLANLLDREGRTAEAIATTRRPCASVPPMRSCSTTWEARFRTVDGWRRRSRVSKRPCGFVPTSPRRTTRWEGALSKAGRREEALAHIEEALRLKPGYASALRNLRRIQSQEPAEAR